MFNEVALNFFFLLLFYCQIFPIILVFCLSISIEDLRATSQPPDNKVFDARKLFEEDQKVILSRAGKIINPYISPLSELLFVTDIENELIHAQETSNEPLLQNVESDTETADLDPIFDIRNFLKGPEVCRTAYE